MRQRRFVLAAAVLLLVCAQSLWAVGVGDKPEMAFKAFGTKNDIVRLSDLKGKIVLIDFWATWCPPCMAEAGHMVEINNKYKDKGLQIIGISLDDDGAALTNVIKSKNFTWPQHFDGGGWSNKFAKEWGIKSVPRTFLLGPDGAVLWTGHPGNIDKPLEDAFKNHPPVLVDPKIVADAGALLDQVDAAINEKNQTEAIKLMAKFPAEAKKDAATATRAMEIGKTLDEAANEMLADVEPLITDKKYLDAAAKLQDLVKGLAGTSAGDKARKRLDELMKMPEAKAQIELVEKNKNASDALAVAQKLQADKKDEQAYLKFKDIVKAFGDTDAGKTAAEQVAIYEKDPTFVKKVREAAAEKKAKGMLNMAASYHSAGKDDLAKKKYQEVIDSFPGTSFAETAKKEFAKLK